MKENKSIVKMKSFDFAIRIINLYKYLSEKKKEYVISKQLLRSGTSVGANVREAHNGESEADFIHKMAIAQKDAMNLYIG
ncbi:four helix bundle protein [Lacihabitans sp. CCS-44]|nr:four helix bundle protein [Lacihabitans sp. CCS-44]